MMTPKPSPTSAEPNSAHHHAATPPACRSTDAATPPHPTDAATAAASRATAGAAAPHPATGTASPAEAPRIATEDRVALARVHEHIARNLDRTISADELCRVALMSTSKLARLFKRAWGVTPQEYARTLRMARACELLADTELPLTEISQRLGYARQGSFSEAFHDRFGMTPSDYRQRQRPRGQQTPATA